jgi:FecR-like protein
MVRNQGYGLWQQILALFLALLLSPFVMFGQGGTPQSAGQITALIPAVSRNTTPAKAKDAVYWNDVLHSEATGRARLNLLDGSILTLGSSTSLKVVQHDANSQQTQLELNYGKLRSRVVQLTKPGAKFEVKTPNAVAGVIGTDFAVTYLNGRTVVQVFSGVVQVTTITGQIITVNAGQEITVNADGSIGGPTQTPAADQQTTISDTSVGGSTTAGGIGGSSTFLHIWLPIVTVALTGLVVGVTTKGNQSGQPFATLPPPPPPQPVTTQPPTVGSGQKTVPRR